MPGKPVRAPAPAPVGLPLSHPAVWGAAMVAARYAYALLPGGAERVAELQRDAMADPGYRARLEAELERSVRSSKQSSQDHSMLADIALLEGRFGDARRHLQLSLAINPGSYEAHRRLGLLALAQREPRRALAEFAAERRLTGFEPGLALGIGRAYQQLGEPRRASEWFRRELKLDPGNQEARDSLEAHEERGR